MKVSSSQDIFKRDLIRLHKRAHILDNPSLISMRNVAGGGGGGGGGGGECSLISWAADT